MDQAASSALQDLREWDSLSPQECEAIARSVAAFLPPAFQFAGVQTYRAGTQQHHVAQFAWHDPTRQSSGTFALIPGGTVTLGFDRAQRPVPSEKLVLEWMGYYLEEDEEEEEEEKSDIPPADYAAFYAYSDKQLLPPRTITLEPFLIETDAQEASKMLPPPFMTYHRFKSTGRKEEYVRRTYKSGHHSIPQRHVAAFLKHQGFRLPSSDEWEYACSAGARSLFYWGNWEFTEREEGPETPVSPNAFGLEIANNPYRWEYCGDPAFMRGGDGGCACCGGEGTLAANLPLASSYYCQLDEKEINLGVYGPWFRRVLSLAALLK